MTKIKAQRGQYENRLSRHRLAMTKYFHFGRETQGINFYFSWVKVKNTFASGITKRSFLNNLCSKQSLGTRLLERTERSSVATFNFFNLRHQ